MKKFQASLLLGALASVSALAADYSVDIVDAGSEFAGAGTALDLHSISNKGVELVRGSPFVFHPRGEQSAYSFEPIAVSISPIHDFVYVVYVNVPNLPIVVQFQATPRGLEYRWQQELSTGDVGLQGSSISTTSHYLIENTYPDVGLWIHVLNQAGEELVFDPGSNGLNVVSGHVDPGGGFYYSCRDVASSYTGKLGPANTVAVYKLDRRVNEDTPPFLTSTDPSFVKSECNGG